MKRGIISLSALLLSLWSALAFAAFTEGTQYKRLAPELYDPTLLESKEGQVEVVYFFSYGCPYCMNFEPYFTKWKNGVDKNKVVGREVPVVFNPAWREYAKAYYAIQSLKRMDLHDDLFKAIIVDRRRLDKEDEMVAWAAEHGVDPGIFRQALNNFATERKVQRGEQLFAHYQLRSSPNVIVNGKYQTDITLAGGDQELIDVINFLVEKESKAS